MVTGQRAESLSIDTRGGTVSLLSMATALWRKVPAPQGGIDTLPVSGSDTILSPAEKTQMIQFCQDLGDKLTESFINPVARSGLDGQAIRQGSFYSLRQEKSPRDEQLRQAPPADTIHAQNGTQPPGWMNA